MTDLTSAAAEGEAERPHELSEQELEALAVEIAAGSRGFHQLPRGLDPVQAALVRRRAVVMRAEKSGRSLELDHIGSFTLDAARASTQNCENFAGAAQIPLGLVGPIRVKGVSGSGVDGEVVVPMATTEGALLASVNRGCRAINAAGGCTVSVEDVGMTRAPVFRTDGIESSRKLVEWVRANEDRIVEEASKTSRYLELVEIRPRVLGTTVLLRFCFRTGDAMGMNMVTIACDRIVSNLIEPITGAECVALSGNYCVDKKPSAVNFQLGRGKSAVAEIVLPPGVLSKTLKTNAAALVEVQLRKNLHGSIAAGALGFNAQFANALAAFFIATGQDLAHVVEGSMGMTHFEERDDGSAYASVYIPDLPVAAVWWWYRPRHPA